MTMEESVCDPCDKKSPPSWVLTGQGSMRRTGRRTTHKSPPAATPGVMYQKQVRQWAYPAAQASP